MTEDISADRDYAVFKVTGIIVIASVNFIQFLKQKWLTEQINWLRCPSSNNIAIMG